MSGKTGSSVSDASPREDALQEDGGTGAGDATTGADNGPGDGGEEDDEFAGGLL